MSEIDGSDFLSIDKINNKKGIENVWIWFYIDFENRAKKYFFTKMRFQDDRAKKLGRQAESSLETFSQR